MLVYPSMYSYSFSNTFMPSAMIPPIVAVANSGTPFVAPMPASIPRTHIAKNICGLTFPILCLSLKLFLLATVGLVVVFIFPLWLLWFERFNMLYSLPILNAFCIVMDSAAKSKGPLQKFNYRSHCPPVFI